VPALGSALDSNRRGPFGAEKRRACIAPQPILSIQGLASRGNSDPSPPWKMELERERAPFHAFSSTTKRHATVCPSQFAAAMGVLSLTLRPRTEAARLRLVLSSILQTFINLHSSIAKGIAALTVQPHFHRPLIAAPLIFRYDIANTLYACFDFSFDTPVDGSIQLLS
jgi:hypothetical protein